MKSTNWRKRSSRSADIARLAVEVDSSGVKKATGNFKEFNNEANKTAKQVTTVDEVMGQFNLSAIACGAGVMGLVKALQGLYAGLKQVATQSINNYAHFESMQKGLETFFQSAEKENPLLRH